ncbi:unnamed protein product [Lactuca virosa]|uniref:Uncharacterized protein n=1 Tax=Lactuca virosa TaxID=75947 RepID=A0AAU9NG06_9ASTR|nr:unnamed protein product [Lactuca virosa]
MANTPFLLETRFTFNPSLQQTFRLPPLRSFPIKLSSGNNNVFKLNYSPYKVIRYSSKLRIKCFFMSPKPKGEYGIGGNPCREDNDIKAVANEVFWRSIKNIQKALQLPVVTGVLLGLLILYNRQHGCVALAASGGRTGGSSFSSSSRPTSSDSSYWSSSSTQPSSSDSSYSSSTWPSSSDYSNRSSSFTRPKSSDSSYSSSTRPSSDYSYSSKRQKTSDTYYSSSTSVEGGCSRPEVGVDDIPIFLFFLIMILLVVYSAMGNSNGWKILKVTFSACRENKCSQAAETTLALLRHPDYCISGYSFVDEKWSIEEVEKIFNQFSIEERGKFDEETLVNVNNIRKQSARSKRSNGFRNEYIVITIIVAAGGEHKLPPINSSAQLKEALQKIASIPSSRIMAVEVLWTPQMENDTLTQQEYIEDYWMLHPL